MRTSRTITQQPMRNYLLQLAVIILIMMVYSYFGVEQNLLYAAVTYLILAFALRLVALRHHYSGMRYYKNSSYAKAIPEFEKSFEFLSLYRWIDTYRYITMLSSQNSYLEMALLNIAFCHAQLGDRMKAKENYIRTLTLFPDCQMAKDELKKL